MRETPTHLSLTVREAVANAPGTLRALARAAGVPHTTLLRVGRGEIEASAALAERLASVLERWGEDCKLHGFRLRQELYRAEREGDTVFVARRGGHAPAVLREAFAGWVRSVAGEAVIAPERWSLEAPVQVDDRAVSAGWLVGQLWNCTDVLPQSECETLSIPAGSTYARAVRTLKRSARRRGESRPAVRGVAERVAFRRHPEPFKRRLVLAEDEVHVWRLSLDVEDDVARRIGRCLSTDERATIARLRFAELRKRRMLSRGLLRRLLAAYLDRPPEGLEFRQGPFGKPHLDQAGRPRLGFNLSHSGDLLLVALAQTNRVGVDVEQIRPIDQAARLAERYFCASEGASIRAAPPPLGARAFLRAWTRKEAVAKAMGEGIVRSLGRLEVTVGPDEPTRLLAIDGDEERAANWSLYDLEPAEGYAGALAVAGRGWRVSAWSVGAEQLLPDGSVAG